MKKQAMAPIFGSKVRLQQFTESDITSTYVSWLNDPVTMRFSNQRFLRHDRQSSLLYLATFEGSPNFFYSVRDKSTDNAIGTMTAYVWPQHGTADLGILIGERSAWGQGLGLDAWITLMHHLLQHLHIRKITAGTLACNTPMLSLAAKSGMTPDGQRNQQELVDGVPHDIRYFAKFSNAET